MEERLYGVHQPVEAVGLLVNGDAASDAIVSELDRDHFPGWYDCEDRGRQLNY